MSKNVSLSVMVKIVGRMAAAAFAGHVLSALTAVLREHAAPSVNQPVQAKNVGMMGVAVYAACVEEGPYVIRVFALTRQPSAHPTVQEKTVG